MASQASRARATSRKQLAKRRSAAPTQKTTAPAELAGHLQQAVSDPGAARPADILTLQRRYGNQSVQELLASASVQARLMVGPAGDHYEQEADQVADQVMLMAAPQIADHRPVAQRQVEEEELQTKPLASTITPLVQQTGGVLRGAEAPAARLSPVTVDGASAPKIQRVYTGVNMADEEAVKRYLDMRFTQLKGKLTRKSARKTKATKILSHTPALYRALVRQIYQRVFGEHIVEPATFEAEKVEPHSPVGSGKMAAVGKTTAASVAGTVGLGLALPLAPLALIGYGIYKLTKITTTWSEKDLQKQGFTDENVTDIRSLGLGFGPHEAKRAAKKRYTANTPASLLSGAERGAIARLWQSKAGPGWLTTAGFKTTDEVEAYARGANFRAWENLPPAFKMQVATMQYYLGDAGLKDFQNTPGYWKGQSCYGKKADVHARDVEAWQKTLVAPSKEALETTLGQGADKAKVTKEFGSVGALQTQNAAAVQIVKRLFIILQKGLAYSEKKGEEFKAWEAPVAVALSHGGRVNIRIPKAAQAGQEHALFNWLMGGEGGMKMAHVYERTAGTHRVAIGKDTKTKKGSFKEKKGYGAAINAMLGTEMGDTFHYGLDVPVGGTGQKDLNGDVILPNGAYGHLYIGYKPPTLERDGALLIGCETDAPGKTNALGHKHTAKATSAEFSSTGGAKKDKIGMEKGGMLVDLNQLEPVGNDWMGQLKLMDQDVTTGNVTLAQLVGKRLQQAQ